MYSYDLPEGKWGNAFYDFFFLQCIVCWNSRQTANRDREALLQQGKVQRHLSPSGRQVISFENYFLIGHHARACMYVI